MTEKERWAYVVSLEEELLKGGALLSEWTTFLAKDAESAYCAGASLAAVLAAQAAIECHLRYEYFDPDESRGWGLYRLLERAPIPSELVADIHSLRQFRNRWVHVGDPCEDADLIDRPEYHEAELEAQAKLAIRVMLQVLYLRQLV